MPDVSIAKYYKNFWSLQGLLAGAFGVLPSASGFFVPGVIFPPLGDQTVLAQCFIVIFSVAVTFLVFLMHGITKTRATRLGFALVGASVISFCVFFWLHSKFVRTIEIPSVDKQEIVSIGYRRTEFADKTFPNVTDVEVLKSRGFSEDEITNLWTRDSVIVARLALFLAFAGTVLPLVGAGSLGVLLRTRETESEVG